MAENPFSNLGSKIVDVFKRKINFVGFSSITNAFGVSDTQILIYQNSLVASIVNNILTEVIKNLGKKDVYSLVSPAQILNCLTFCLNSRQAKFTAYSYYDKEKLIERYKYIDINNLWFSSLTKSEQLKVESLYSKKEFVVVSKFELMHQLNLVVMQLWDNIHNLEKEVLVSGSKVFKVKDLQETLNTTEIGDFKNQIEGAFSSIKTGKSSVLSIDSESSIEEISTKASQPKVELFKQQLDTIYMQLVMLTGLPASFFHGSFVAGLGNNGINEALAINRGLYNFYYKYLADFFFNLDEEITFKPEYINIPNILHLAEGSQFIDAKKVYEDFGIPVLPENKGGENDKVVDFSEE